MMFGNFSFWNLFHRTPNSPEFERWHEGSLGVWDISRMPSRDLETLSRTLNYKLKEKRSEFKKLAKKANIKIDENAIHREIQEILDMDSESLDALQRELERKLRKKRAEFNQLVGGYWG